MFSIDILVGFEQQQYVVTEGTAGTEVCVEFKECLQRPASVQVTMGTGKALEKSLLQSSKRNAN